MFNSKEYWESRYANGGNSGNGSYGYLAKYKAQFITYFIKEHGIESVLEFGCGDGNNMKMISEQNPTLTRLNGVDVSKTALSLCRAKMPKSKFYLADTFISDTQYDLTLSMDVIYHLIEDDVYEDYMNKLTSLQSEWLIIYASDLDQYYTAHMRSRKFTEHELLNERYGLVEMIPNKYPYDGKQGSVSDWYIFKLK